MSAETTRELAQLLGADDRDVGFLAYLPEEAVGRLARAASEHLEAQSRALDRAIVDNTRRLPAGLSGLARSVLG